VQLQGFAFVMCRLFAVAMVVLFLVPIGSTSFMAALLQAYEVTNYSAGRDAGYVLLFILFYGLPALLLWFKAGTIARWITRSNEPLLPNIRAEMMQQVGFSIVGLFLVVQSTYQAASLGFLYFWQSTRPMWEGATYVDVPRWFGVVVTFGIGAWLLLGSRRFIAFLRYLRGR
jgi:hypothetical protein